MARIEHDKSFCSSTTKEALYLREQLEEQRRLVDKAIQRTSTLDKNQDRQLEILSDIEKNIEGMQRQLHVVETENAVIQEKLKQRSDTKDVVPGLSLSSLLSLLALLGSIVTAYVVLKEDIAIAKTDVVSMQKDLDGFERKMEAELDAKQVAAKNYTDNLLRLQNLKTENAIRNVVNELKSSLALVRRNNFDSDGFTRNNTHQVRNLRTLEDRLNQSILELDVLRKKMHSMEKTN